MIKTFIPSSAKFSRVRSLPSNVNSWSEVNLPHKRRAEAVTQYWRLCGRPAGTSSSLRINTSCPLVSNEIKMPLSLIKPRNEQNHQRGWLRRCKCTCAVHIRGSCTSAGRGFEIPEQVLLEMITLIKPLLSKLPPHPSHLPPSAALMKHRCVPAHLQMSH